MIYQWLFLTTDFKGTSSDYFRCRISMWSKETHPMRVAQMQHGCQEREMLPSLIISSLDIGILLAHFEYIVKISITIPFYRQKSSERAQRSWVICTKGSGQTLAEVGLQTVSSAALPSCSNIWVELNRGKMKISEKHDPMKFWKYHPIHLQA